MHGRETWSRPRASLGCAIVVGRRGSLVSAFEPAWRTQRGRPGVEDDRFKFALERNTLRPPMSSSSWSSRMVAASFPEVCVNLEREEHMRDEWLVPDLCENGHRDPDGVVRSTI